MVATAGDVADWGAALYGGAVLDAGAMGEMLDVIGTGVPDLEQGLGVFVYGPGVIGAPAYGHAGSIIGYMSWMLYLVEEQSSIAVSLNRFGAEPKVVMERLVEVVRDR